MTDFHRLLRDKPFLAHFEDGSIVLVLAPSLKNAADIASNCFVYQPVQRVEKFECQGVAYSRESGVAPLQPQSLTPNDEEAARGWCYEHPNESYFCVLHVDLGDYVLTTGRHGNKSVRRALVVEVNDRGELIGPPLATRWHGDSEPEIKGEPGSPLAEPLQTCEWCWMDTKSPCVGRVAAKLCVHNKPNSDPPVTPQEEEAMRERSARCPHCGAIDQSCGGQENIEACKSMREKERFTILDVQKEGRTMADALLIAMRELSIEDVIKVLNGGQRIYFDKLKEAVK